MRRLTSLALATMLLAAACSGGGSPGPSVPPVSPSPSVPASALTPTKLTVGLGYIPSVQFAQFYLAQQAGYYRDAGLDVTFQNKIDPDLITLVGQGAVDAATGFINNEPVQLEQSGTPATLLKVDSIVPLPGNGLIASSDGIQAKSTPLKAFVAATLRAMNDVIADPQKGLDAAVAAVPELGKDRALQLAILKATIDTWQSAYTKAHGLGAIDRDGWTKTVAFMTGLPDHPVARQVSVDELVSAAPLPKELAPAAP